MLSSSTFNNLTFDTSSQQTKEQPAHTNTANHQQPSNDQMPDGGTVLLKKTQASRQPRIYAPPRIRQAGLFLRPAPKNVAPHPYPLRYRFLPR